MRGEMWFCKVDCAFVLGHSNPKNFYALLRGNILNAPNFFAIIVDNGLRNLNMRDVG